MNLKLVESIASAVLYEGYLLYPYRPSTIKNRQRFNFGVVYPQCYGLANNEPWSMQTECLATGDRQTRVNARIRFLHLLSRENRDVPLSWQEAVEREVITPEIGPGCGNQIPYTFPREVKNENGVARRQENINGFIEIAAEQVAERLSRITVRIMNLTQFESAAPSGMEARNDEARYIKPAVRRCCGR
jgi:hydrogenase maturation protease